ncbi:MAG: hypothetical protein Fur0022_13240 [Anaerolineales bacterium]
MKSRYFPRFRSFLRWLVPNGGTFLMFAVFLFTQSVWARPAQENASVATSATAPNATTISYQGRLADEQGNPLNESVDLTFTLYDNLIGGNVKWGPEDHFGVPVSGGMFQVRLGILTEGGIPLGIWDSDLSDLYLEIVINGEPLSPREPVQNVLIPKIKTEQIADGAVTQAKAPTLIQSANGENQIIRAGNNVFSGSNGSGEIQITYPCFPNGVGTFLALNGHRAANTSQVVGHNGPGQCSTTIIVSPPTSNSIRINWIAIGN